MGNGVCDIPLQVATSSAGQSINNQKQNQENICNVFNRTS